MENRGFSVGTLTWSSDATVAVSGG